MFTLCTEPYYNTYSQCYTNIITINALPKGPLRSIIRRIQFNKLGPNRSDSRCTSIKKCGLALINLDMGCSGSGGKCNMWMSPNEIPDLFSFLAKSGYTIDTSVTNMMSFGDVKLDNSRKILCFISYNK